MPRYEPVPIDEASDELARTTDDPVPTIIGDALLTVTIGPLRIAVHPEERGSLILYRETEE